MRFRNYLIVFVVLSMTLSCSNESRYDRLSRFLLEELDYHLSEQISAIAVVSESGGCLSCSRTYSKFITTYVSANNVLFLICGSGTQLDISFFLERGKEQNILFDFHNKFRDLGLIDKSGMIFLDNHTIDTITTINVETLEADLDYIENRLSKNESIIG